MTKDQNLTFQNKFTSFKFIKKTENKLEKIPYLKLIYLALALVFITISLSILLKKNLPPEIPLFYGNPEGSEQLFSSRGIIIPSLIALSSILINVITSFTLKKKFLKKILSLTSFVVSVLATITTFKIILLVGSF